MKIKSIITCGLLLLGVGAATTSCEDMMTPDNNLVTTNLAPQDTLYQMMGIIQRMQKLADRTILLGELRADLVDVDPVHASSDLQELSNNAISLTNKYNSPAEYYSVINNCNIYLANVDSLFKVYGDYYYRKEVIAARCFRAWCYLELAKIYGSVPFFTEPILTPDAAEQALAKPKADMLTILDFCIDDIAPFANLPENGALRPSYGTDFMGFHSSSLFLPFRALLGELYLWRGSFKGKGAGQSDFLEAVRMYHDYLCYPGEEKAVQYDACEWNSADWTSVRDYIVIGAGSLYKNHYMASTKEDYYVAVLPIDTAAYFGNTSDLRAIFNSTIGNLYYPSVTPSARMSNISKSQNYLYLNYKTGTLAIGDTLLNYAPTDPATVGSERRVGDLRLNAIYKDMSNISESKYNENVNPVKQYILKWTNGAENLSNDRRQTFIYYYTTNTIYLHLAEALNLAGFPETAMAVLTHGLSYETLNDESYIIHNKQSSTGTDTTLRMRVVSENEFNRLCNIKTIGYTNTTTDYDADPVVATRANNSFVIWRKDRFTGLNKQGNNRTGSNSGAWRTVYRVATYTQIGLHSLGSGDSDFNEHYRLLNPYDDTKSGGISFVDIINNIKQGVRPDVPLGWEAGKAPLTKAEVEALVGKTITVAQYNAYVEEYNAYPTKLANFEADMAYLSSPAVVEKCQERVRWLILQEEALESSFEGTRFYDILRHQMQGGKVGGVGSTITMPDSIVKLYGPTPNMEGKPWYLPLRAR